MYYLLIVSAPCLACDRARILFLWAMYIVFPSRSTISVVLAIYLFITLDFP